MSTAFFADSTGEWAFTRWCGSTAREETEQTGSRSRVDFGVGDRVFSVVEAADAGETFTGEDGERWAAAEVREAVASGKATFGEFGGTFEAGSGDAAAWAGVR